MAARREHVKRNVEEGIVWKLPVMTFWFWGFSMGAGVVWLESFVYIRISIDLIGNKVSRFSCRFEVCIYHECYVWKRTVEPLTCFKCVGLLQVIIYLLWWNGMENCTIYMRSGSPGNYRTAFANQLFSSWRRYFDSNRIPMLDIPCFRTYNKWIHTHIYIVGNGEHEKLRDPKKNTIPIPSLSEIFICTKIPTPRNPGTSKKQTKRNKKGEPKIRSTEAQNSVPVDACTCIFGMVCHQKKTSET